MLQLPDVLAKVEDLKGCNQEVHDHAWDKGTTTVLKEANVILVVGGNDCTDQSISKIGSHTRRTFVFEPSLAYDVCLKNMQDASTRLPFRAVEVRVRPGLRLQDHPAEYKGVAELLADRKRYPNQQLAEGGNIVFVINAAGSDKYSMATMIAHAESENKMSSLASSAPTFWKGTASLDVAMVPIQDVLGPSTIVDIMHWDTQGHEPHVALGAKDMFLQKRVRYVNMEFGPNMMAKNFPESDARSHRGVAAIKLLQLMHSLGFVCYEWTGNREVSDSSARDFRSFVMAHFDASYTNSFCRGRCFEEGLGRASELFCAEASSLVGKSPNEASFLGDLTQKVWRLLSC